MGAVAWSLVIGLLSVLAFAGWIIIVAWEGNGWPPGLTQALLGNGAQLLAVLSVLVAVVGLGGRIARAVMGGAAAPRAAPSWPVAPQAAPPPGWQAPPQGWPPQTPPPGWQPQPPQGQTWPAPPPPAMPPQPPSGQR